MPEPPAHLTDDERAAWDELVGWLGAPAETMPPPGLEAAACQVARMRDAHRRIEREGEIVLDARDRPVPHPALAIERQAQAEVRAWLAALAPRAAAPASSSPGASAAPSASSPLDELARRRRAAK